MKGYYTERNYKGEMPYTDLALERHRADISLPGVEYSKEKTPVGSLERIKISSKVGAESIGRPIGLYDTLSMQRMDLLDSVEMLDATDQVAARLNRIIDDSDIFPGRLLVAGLGWRYLIVTLIYDMLRSSEASYLAGVKSRSAGTEDSETSGDLACGVKTLDCGLPV